ncbi:hypothetical protein ACN47E_006771 [Coniothyrium glycines]
MYLHYRFSSIVLDSWSLQTAVHTVLYHPLSLLRFALASLACFVALLARTLPSPRSPQPRDLRQRDRATKETQCHFTILILPSC